LSLKEIITIESVARLGHDLRGGAAKAPVAAILGLDMPTAEELKQRIETAIPGARAEVEDYTGGGDHFRATVTAEAFAGRSRIEQHRLVYEVFGAEIGGPIHALSLKTEAG
jgi:stress-induced morphogen